MAKDDSKPYDLEDRTFEFAKASRAFVKQLPRTIANIEDAKQFIRASGSVGANYIEANESIGKKDFLMKVKTCRREAKESGYWLRLLDCDGELDSATKTVSRSCRPDGDLRRKCPQVQGAAFEFRIFCLFGTSGFEFRI